MVAALGTLEHTVQRLWTSRNVRGVTGNALLSRYAASSWRKLGLGGLEQLDVVVFWVGRCFLKSYIPPKLINHKGRYINISYMDPFWGLELFMPSLDLELTA